MDSRDASVRSRLILWFASGLFFAALALAVSSRRPSETEAAGGRAIPRWLDDSKGDAAKGASAGGPAGGASSPPSSSAVASPGPSALSASPDEASTKGGVAFARPGRDAQAEDDEALFAAMERLERRMAAGMSRARESVLSLEYTAAGEPADARRAAVGVVVDGRRGDVLSVRIDRPSPPPGGAGGGPPPIIARDAFGRRHLARWIAEDAETGLTLLEIPPGVLRSIRPAAEGPALGGQVFVVGNPFGLGHSVSRGQVSGLDRSLKLHDQQLNGLIQVQTPLFPGDNGAAVVNYRGQWLGLIRGILASPSQRADDVSDRGDELGFAIPADDAWWVAEQLRESGRVDRAYLGVRFAPDSRDPGEAEGATLSEVLPDTPAALNGLQSGDRVVSYDGRPTRAPVDLTERLARTRAGQYVRLEIVRGEGPQRQQRSVWIQTAQRPAAPEPPPAALAKAEPAPPSPSPPPDVVPTSAVVPAPSSQPPPPQASPAPAQAAASPPPAAPRAEELPISLPRAVVERIDQLERRLERLEGAPRGVAEPHADAP